MSLYDDEDLGAPPTNVAVGWSAVKMMHPKQAKSLPPIMGPPKPSSTAAATFTPSINKPRSTFTSPVLAPVIDLKSKKQIEDSFPSSGKFTKPPERVIRNVASSSTGQIGIQSFNEPNFLVNNEYDPQWPNDYYKVIQEMRGGDKKNDDDCESSESKKRRYTEEGRAKARERFARDAEGQQLHRSDTPPSGFGRRPRDDYSDEDEDSSEDHRDRRRGSKMSRRSAGSGSTSGGAAIAPPPSLTETTSPSSPPAMAAAASTAVTSTEIRPSQPQLTQPTSVPTPPPGSTPGLGVAAKIMAKYGYKQGQGLGRSEQGMSQALSVEKTSRRGGRIVHEKDLMPPPMFGESFKTPVAPGEETTPPQIEDTDEYGDPVLDVQDSNDNAQMGTADKPSITDLMKNPAKVVLCQNMVGPGEVDEELEPEIKEECNTKYGDVQSVVIYEIPHVAAEEAVRIFIEFKRVESAIKAVVDLNGRFFGGREVRASFYDVEKFKNLNLND